MKVFSFDDFTGGIQEGTGPNDFTERQWAELKGVVPVNQVTFETQWALQQLGALPSGAWARDLAVLPSEYGDFLVVISSAGEIYWALAPASTAPTTVDGEPNEALELDWQKLSETAPNEDIDTEDEKPIVPDARLRFVSQVRFKPWDNETTTTSDTNYNVTTGLLVNSRFQNRWYDADADGVAEERTEEVGVTVDGEPGQEPRNAWVLFPWNFGSGAVLTALRYPYAANYPSGYTVTDGKAYGMQPYWYVKDHVALPGKGNIPHSNVGCMWDGRLILGDIWHTNKTLLPPTANNTTSQPLKNRKDSTHPGNTARFRSSIYYSEQHVDVWDPRSVLNLGTSDVALTGLHALERQLIAIFTAAGDADGVVSVSGELSALHPYDGSAPSSMQVRRTLVRGGLGTPYWNDNAGITADKYDMPPYSVLWPEAGVVVFIDRLGGVWYTNGRQCDRLDRYGPKPPAAATRWDHVAAVGKHLFVWRNRRLLLFSLISGNRESLAGCWTELSLPERMQTADSSIASMVGGTQDMFFLVDGQVWRWATECSSADRGTVSEGSATVAWDCGDVTPVAATRTGTGNTYDATGKYTEGFTADQVCDWASEYSIKVETAEDVYSDYTTVRAAGSAPMSVTVGRPLGAEYPKGVQIKAIARRSVARADVTMNYTGISFGTGYTSAKYLAVDVSYNGGTTWTRRIKLERSAGVPLPGSIRLYESAKSTTLPVSAGKATYRAYVLSSTAASASINVGQTVTTAPTTGIVSAAASPSFFSPSSLDLSTALTIAEPTYSEDDSVLPVVVSTATVGDGSRPKNFLWHRMGVTFSTPGSCTLQSTTMRSAPALQASSPAPYPGDAPVVTYMKSPERTYTNGIYEFVMPAGIGSQPQASATVVFTGHVRLQAVTFWVAGETPKRGDR